MKKLNLITFTNNVVLICLLASFFLFSTGCQKSNDIPDSIQEDVLQTDHRLHGVLNDFLQVNLVANNNQYGAPNIDPLLINGWGIAFSTTGTPWIGAQGGHVSTVYNREGGTVLAPVHIPSPGGAEGGNPTGVVFNGSTTDFIIPAGNTTGAPAPARFIFVGVDGIVSAWNGTWGNHAYSKFNNVATSAYTGLTLATNAGNNFLYAADFKARKIAVWDKNWNPVTMSFKDHRLPWGYSPFNIQVIGDKLYVTYAKVGPDGRSQAGRGKGFVNIFSTDGKLLKRFADNDKLNAPWAVAKVPDTFFPQKNNKDDENGRHGQDNNKPSILIGNFGDGRINVYTDNGKFLGQMRSNRHTLVIDGLWALTFPPSTSTIDPNRLYFAAGPKHETNGLFGYIIKDSTAKTGYGQADNDY
jgi:uncharacterized protein (TIGR03118 family)